MSDGYHTAHTEYLITIFLQPTRPDPCPTRPDPTRLDPRVGQGLLTSISSLKQHIRTLCKYASTCTRNTAGVLVQLEQIGLSFYTHFSRLSSLDDDARGDRISFTSSAATVAPQILTVRCYDRNLRAVLSRYS